MNSTEQRLQAYYDFPAEILEAVAETAEEQNKLSVDTLLSTYGVADAPELLQGGNNGIITHPIEYVMLKPKGDSDENRRRIFHLPMACRLDESMVLRGIRAFGAMQRLYGDNEVAMMMVGNPSSVGTTQTKLTAFEAAKVLATGNLAPAVKPLLEHLSEVDGIKYLDHLGYSYGATKAATAAAESAKYGMNVDHGVFIEPANVVARSVLRLFGDFNATNAQLEDYVQQTGSAPLFESRAGDGGKLEGLRWYGGLARLSNLAVISVLKKDGFSKTVERALENQPDMQAAIGWGTESLITPVKDIQAQLDKIPGTYDDRLAELEFEGMHHAGGDDIDLHAAMLLTGLQGVRHGETCRCHPRS